MLIENWDKIYGDLLVTTSTVYEIGKDSMRQSPDTHTLRLKPNNNSKNGFTIVVTKIENRIVCGLYIDVEIRPIEVFEVSKLDLKRIDTFKNLLSAKIQNYA